MTKPVYDPSELPGPEPDAGADALGWLAGSWALEAVGGKPEGAKLRAWVLGCNTGEAVYSLAIALRERLDGAATPLQIFATDIDSLALAAARAGRYPAGIAEQIAVERLERWFVRKGPDYIVKLDLRESCIFSAHDVLRDPPFSRIDLICCRVPLRRLGPALQDQVLQTLHFALNPQGLLWLEREDAAAPPGALFEPVADSPRLYRRRDKPGAPGTKPAAANWQATPTLARWRQAGAAAMTAEAERIASNHGPPFMVVDDALNVLHFSARIARYLSPSAGTASLNVLQLVHSELRPGLAALLERVVRTRQAAQTPRLLLDTGAGLTMLAEPMANSAPDKPRTIVMFCDGVDRSDARAANDGSMDAALNSANQQLESSREELRSLGEEFQVVNAELAQRVGDLARANSDMRNVLESTQIAIVFLDNDLLVQSFTPAAANVIHLLAGDIGRPIGDFALRVDYPGLARDSQHVLRTLATLEREVDGLDSTRRYVVRILPYRRIDNFIAGVVLTFLDMTATYEAERARRDSEERFRMMADVVPAFLFIADHAGAWQYVNPPFYAFTGLAEGAALGDGWWAAVHPQDAASGRLAWQNALDQRDPVELECRLCQAGGCESWFLLRAVPRLDADGAVTAWFGSCTDIDARRRAGRRQRELLGELQHRVKNILAVVRSVMIRSVESSKTMDDLSAHLSGRISAIARIQSMIARNAGDAVVLSELIDEELAAHGGQADWQTDVEGPIVLLTDKLAESLGLALHELTTNAIKFGALSASTGRLRVRWQIYPVGLVDPPQQRLVLEWQESGVPITDLQPRRSGFGRHLLESGLAGELGAATSLEFRPGGIRWLIQVVMTEAQPSFGHAASARIEP